jgi:L-aminopeptidase/D-esterase-like protein
VGRELDCEKWPPCWSRQPREGSIIVVVATDAPLLPHQLKRLARRISLGVGHTGSISGNGSGDIFLAFSTANSGAARRTGEAGLTMLANAALDPIFEAVIQAAEEAIINSMVAAETMVGRDDHKSIALPHEEVRRLMKQFGRGGAK